ncbi:MAG TPA: hypothetical protein VH280_04860 [Verrucomicrobiae bacterium]|jgi:hypothetical protein|nr:hypothetical protein [Verrucomicrobiae bacterium]
MKKLLVLVALLFAAQWLSAQDTRSPLLLYISGPGKIVPFHDGDMLDVGRKYVMTAVPDRGCVFTNWVQVNVFTEIAICSECYPPETNTETIIVPLAAQPVKNRVLHFTMEPEQVLAESAGFELTMSTGWQANFVPDPRKPHRK